MSDEIIAEVYAIKDAIGANVNSNIHNLFKDIKCGEAKLQVAGIQLIAPPTPSVHITNSALQRIRFVRR